MATAVINTSPTHVFGAHGVELRSLAGGTLYYDDAKTVSSSANDGSLTAGGSVTLTQGKWLVSASQTRIYYEELDLVNSRLAEVEAVIEPDFYVDATGGSDQNPGTSAASSVATIQAAVDAASAGDVIWVAPGQYDETVTVDTAVTIIGNGPRGSAYIEPETAEAEGMLVTADDVTLKNLGVAGDSDADYALKVGATTDAPARFRAEGCKFEGPDGTVVVLQGAADVRIEDCEFAWGGSGLLFDNNDDGFCTQVTVSECLFHNLTDVGVGLAADGGVLNLNLRDSVFDNAEDGTAPTDYVKVDRAGDTGVLSGNRFARTTNEADVITLADGILYVANETEAGITTARPS